MASERSELRDRFAAAAPTSPSANNNQGTFDEFAEDAFRYADAMMAARGPGTPTYALDARKCDAWFKVWMKPPDPDSEPASHTLYNEIAAARRGKPA